MPTHKYYKLSDNLMINPDDTLDQDQHFLIELYQQSHGDPSVQVSMYDIGTVLGLERAVAQQTAEHLIGQGLVEIRTLTGDIGISAEGIAAAVKLGAQGGKTDQTIIRLGSAPTMDKDVCEVVSQVVAALKIQAGSLGLDFDPLTELVADLNTIAMQMTSARPKTDIIRACLKSIAAVLATTNDRQSLMQVQNLLGE